MTINGFHGRRKGVPYYIAVPAAVPRWDDALDGEFADLVDIAVEGDEAHLAPVARHGFIRAAIL